MTPARPALLEFRLLGSFEVRQAGRTLELAGAKARTLVAILVLARRDGRHVRADTLAEAVWEGCPPGDVRGSLQALVSRARRVLEPTGATIVHADDGYALSGEHVDLDLERVEVLAAQARAAASAGRPADGVAHCRAALTCWRGESLAEFADRDFARADAVRFDELRLSMTETLADALLAANDSAETVRVLEPHVAAHPLREQAAAQLVVALHRCGRRADALAAYRAARERLVEELGLDPGPELRRAEALVLSATSEEAVVIAATSSDVARSNLPTLGGRFVGRDAELAELTQLAGAQRLVTVWGPGGAGKTRLAVEVAGRTIDGFADGVWFAGLAALDSADQVAPAVMSALGMLGAPEGDPIALLASNLRSRQLLLVLDNCEHVLDGAARVAHALLTRCPQVRVLATSREPLLVPDECVWPAPSLSLPAPDADLAAVRVCDAGAFFLDRARLAAPGLRDAEETAPVVAEICRRLDGIPLALELAAARVRTLGLRGVADQLDNQFALLTGGQRTADSRHRTMRAAIDWSFALASRGERDLLAALSVFPGPFDPADASGVRLDDGVPDTIELLTGLVDRSLLVALPDEQPPLFRLLEPVRQYAAEHLRNANLTERTRDRLLAHVLDRVVPDITVWLDEEHFWRGLSYHRATVRFALGWALAQGNAAGAICLVGRLWIHWVYSSDPEDQPGLWSEQALSLPGPVPERDVLIARACRWWRTGELGDQVEVLEAAHRTGDLALYWVVRFSAATVASRTDPDTGRRLLSEALEGAQAAGYPSIAPMCHLQLAWAALGMDDVADARAHAARAVAISTDHHAYSSTYHATLAIAHALSGDHDVAEAAALRAVAIAREVEMAGVLAHALLRAATTALLGAQYALAVERLRELLVLLRRLCTHRWVRDTLHATALVLDATGRRRQVAALLDYEHDELELSETPGGTLPAIAAALETARRRAESPCLPGPRCLDDVLALAWRALDEPAR